MKKGSKKEIKTEEPTKKKLTSKQKEIIITLVAIIIAALIGIYLGKVLYEAFNGPL